MTKLRASPRLLGIVLLPASLTACVIRVHRRAALTPVVMVPGSPPPSSPPPSTRSPSSPEARSPPAPEPAADPTEAETEPDDDADSAEAETAPANQPASKRAGNLYPEFGPEISESHLNTIPSWYEIETPPFGKVGKEGVMSVPRYRIWRCDRKPTCTGGFPSESNGWVHAGWYGREL